MFFLSFLLSDNIQPLRKMEANMNGEERKTIHKDESISETNDHGKLRKTLSNLQKAKKVVKDQFLVWNCCFCPHLQSIECCNSCEVDVQSHIGI